MRHALPVIQLSYNWPPCRTTHIREALVNQIECFDCNKKIWMAYALIQHRDGIKRAVCSECAK